jgi:hypothetical protein
MTSSTPGAGMDTGGDPVEKGKGKKKHSTSAPHSEYDSVTTDVETSPPRHSTSPKRTKKQKTDRDVSHTREMTRSKTRHIPPLRK